MAATVGAGQKNIVVWSLVKIGLAQILARMIYLGVVRFMEPNRERRMIAGPEDGYSSSFRANSRASTAGEDVDTCCHIYYAARPLLDHHEDTFGCRDQIDNFLHRRRAFLSQEFRCDAVKIERKFMRPDWPAERLFKCFMKDAKWH